jgi:hypothetical protein
MKSEARLHHYVPQFYLRGFARPGGGKFPKVSVFDLERWTQYDTSIRNVGGVRDFNRVEVQNVAPDAVETAYSALETQFQQAIGRIDASRTFEGEDRIWVLNLIALLAIRNPTMRAIWSDVQTKMTKSIVGMTLDTRERWEATKAKMQAAGQSVNENVSYDQLKEFFDRGEYDVEVATEHHIRMEMVGVNAILPFLVERHWLMLVADEHTGPFVTSNHPVTLIWKHPEKIPAVYRRSPGYGMRETQVVFPINKRLALMGEFEGDGSGVMKASRTLVAGVNSRIINFARQVFAPKVGFHWHHRDGDIRLGATLLNDTKEWRKRHGTE